MPDIQMIRRILLPNAGAILNTGGGTPPPVPTAVALDAPLTAAMVSAGKGIDAFGLHQMVEGFSGAVGTFKRLSDSVTISTIGFDTSGRFDNATLDTWRAGADVDLVSLNSQTGSGRTLAGNGTVALVRSNVYQRFGTTLDTSTGQLTRSATLGGVGADLGGIGHMTVGPLTFDLTASNVEAHILMSPQGRKIATNDTTDTVGGATTTGEVIMAYGLTQNIRAYWQMAGAAAAGTSRIQTSGTDSTNANIAFQTGGVARWKAKAQNVLTFGITTGGSIIGYGFGRRFQSQVGSANNIAAVAAGTMNNGTLHIGTNFGSTSNNTGTTTLRGNYVFGGVIITKGLTDAERFAVHAKLSAMGQQHRAQTTAKVLAYYDEWFFAKDVDASGNVAGRNALAVLNFNKGGSGTDWDFAYSIPNHGIQSIRSPTANDSNKFMADRPYFAGVTTGSVLALHLNEDASNTLRYSLGRESATYAGAAQQRLNLGIGFDHNAAGFISRWGIAKDTSESLFTGRQKVFASSTSGFKAWGAAIYETNGGGANQSMGKYNTNVTHNTFQDGEVITDPDVGSVTLDRPTWLNQNAYQLDAPVLRPVPENLTTVLRNDALILHMANFEAPTGYDPNASYATRKPQRLTGKTTSYLATPNLPVGHMDGSYAVNPNAGVADGNSDDRLQSFAFQGPWQGSRVAYAFKAGVLTQAQMEEVQVNMYKLVA